MSATAIIKAIGIAADLLTLGNELISAHGQLTALVQKAQTEGRDHLTEEEWAQVTALDDSARARLADAIAKAKAAGSA